jgi:hypothetical protein
MKICDRTLYEVSPQLTRLIQSVDFPAIRKLCNYVSANTWRISWHTHSFKWTGKLNKVVPVHVVKAYGGNRGMPPLILNIGTKWRWVVGFTPRPLEHPGKFPIPVKKEGSAGHGPGLTFWRTEKFHTLRRPPRSLVTHCIKLCLHLQCVAEAPPKYIYIYIYIYIYHSHSS